MQRLAFQEPDNQFNIGCLSWLTTCLVLVHLERLFSCLVLVHLERLLTCLLLVHLELHVEVLVTELRQGDVEQLPVGVQVVHHSLRLRTWIWSVDLEYYIL